MSTFNRMELKKALAALGKSVETKERDGLTSRVFFNSDNGIQKIITTDMEIYTEIDISSSDLIECDINYTDLKKFVSAATGDDISIEIVDSGVSATDGTMKALFLDLVIDEGMINIIENFDTSAGVEYAGEIRITEDIFNAVDTKNPKFELNGMLIDFKEGNIAATDTRRLSVKGIEKSDLESIIIPKKALISGEVISDLVIKDYTASFTIAGMRRKTKLIQGRYPLYQRIIPNYFNFEINFNGDELKNILKKTKENHTALIFKDNKVTIVTKDHTVLGEIDCHYPSAIPLKLLFNEKYIYDAITGNKACIKINSNDLPFMVEDTVIMPIILGEDDITSDSNIEAIKSDFVDNEHIFKYSTPNKKPAKRVNKDKIISELQKEINALKSELETYRNNDNEIKRSFLNKIKEVA